jgi:hypothetical protein
MNSWQRGAGAFFLAVAAVVLWQAASVLRVTEDGLPGSGFMPLVVGLLLAALSVALIVVHRGRDRERVPFWEGRAWLQPLLALGMTALFIVVFDEVGAITSVGVLVAGWLRLVGRKPVPVALGTGAATAGVVWLVFARLLQTPFPRGLVL